MLVLTRRCGESLVIGKDGAVRVRFLAAKGKQVRIGIEAPDEVSVNREEIYHKKCREAEIKPSAEKRIPIPELET